MQPINKEEKERRTKPHITARLSTAAVAFKFWSACHDDDEGKPKA